LELPAANQCHFNIYSATAQLELVEFCQKHGITFIGYSPFGIPDWHTYPKEISTTGKALEEPKLLEMAQKYNRTAA